MKPDWYSRTHRRLFFDMHLPDWTQLGQSGGDQFALRNIATRFDPEYLIREFVRARINLAIIFAKCQYGNFYYNTGIGHKHTGLGDLDFLGEMVRLGHRHDIRIIGYYSNMWDTQLARQHPEWMAEEADGSLSYNRWPTMSLLSPYRDLVKSHLHEMFSKYDLDGVWSDILSDLPSFDAYTRAEYRVVTGDDVPRSPKQAGWLKFVRWQQQMLLDYVAECRSLVRGIQPDAAYIINFFGTPFAQASQGLSFLQLAQSDIGSTEGYTEWHGLMFPSFAARYIRAGMMDRPFEVLTSRFVHTWDFTVRSRAQMRFEAFSVIANGGAVCIDDEPYHDGTIESVVYDDIADIYSEIERRETWLENVEPLPYATLYVSQNSRELDELMNETRPPRKSLTPDSDLNPSDSDLLASWMGMFKALTESHIPVQFVDERPERLATLTKYRVLILSNILHLGASEVDAITAYVEAGGGLVVTGATSLYDRLGIRQLNFALSNLLGVDWVCKGSYTFPYLQCHLSPITVDMPTRPIPHYTAIHHVRVNADDVLTAVTRRDPLIETSGETYYHNNMPPPDADTSEPVITYRKVGKGRVAYCSALPESNYARLGHEPYRHLIANMVTWAAQTQPPISAHQLMNTEIIPTLQGDDLIIHLVTGNPTRAVRFGLHRTADTIEEPATLSNITLSIPAHTVAAYLLPSGEELPIERQDSTSQLFLPSVGDWEMIRLTGDFSENRGMPME